MTDEQIAAGLSDLRTTLDKLPPEVLASLGVTLSPAPDDWEWVRDCLATALRKCGRRSAIKLVHFPFAAPHTTYSIGFNQALLGAFGIAVKEYLAAPASAKSSKG